MIRQNYQKVVPFYNKEIAKSVTITARTIFMLAELERLLYDEDEDFENSTETGCQLDGE